MRLSEDWGFYECELDEDVSGMIMVDLGAKELAPVADKPICLELTVPFLDPAETGFPTNMTLRSLGILRAKDVPEIEVHIVEVPQPRSPYGVKGVGEIGLVPTAGAIATALYEVDGLRRTRTPMGVHQPILERSTS